MLFIAQVCVNGLKPILRRINKAVDSYLVEELGWGAVVAVEERIAGLTELDPMEHNKTVHRKVHRAARDSRGRESDHIVFVCAVLSL